MSASDASLITFAEKVPYRRSSEIFSGYRLFSAVDEWLTDDFDTQAPKALVNELACGAWIAKITRPTDGKSEIPPDMTQLSYVHGASEAPFIGNTIGVRFDLIVERFAERD